MQLQITRLAHLWAFIKPHPYLIAIWTAITYACSPEHSGFVIYLIAAPCLLYAAIRCLFNLRSSEVRNQYLLFIAFILLSSAIVTSVHVWRHHKARNYADHIVAELEKHQQQYGKLPVSLDEIPALAHEGNRPHMLYYSNDNANPFLFYTATFVPFEGWRYDFKSKIWVYVYD